VHEFSTRSLPAAAQFAQQSPPDGNIVQLAKDVLQRFEALKVAPRPVPEEPDERLTGVA
jgi:hypothetical protein